MTKCQDKNLKISWEQKELLKWNKKHFPLFLTGIPKTGTRDPSGTLQKPENRNPSETLLKLENRDPSGTLKNPTKAGPGTLAGT